MIKFKATIERDSRDPDKKGWSYIIINKTLSKKIHPGVRKGFRVKGKLDDFTIKQTSVLPVQGERFMLPINAKIRKGTGKGVGDTLLLQLEVDKSEIKLSADLLECLQDEPKAYAFFKSLNKSNQRYFSWWINEAKTHATKAKRIAQAVTAMAQGKSYPQMIREGRGRA